MRIKIKIENPENFRKIIIDDLVFENHHGYLDTNSTITGFYVYSLHSFLKELIKNKAIALLNINRDYLIGAISKSMIFNNVRFSIEEIT